MCDKRVQLFKYYTDFNNTLRVNVWRVRLFIASTFGGEKQQISD